MTHDPSNPVEPNSSDSQPTPPQPPESPTSEAASVPESTPEPIKPSSPLEGGSEPPPEESPAEVLPPEGTEAVSADPIESVAMTDATQHSPSSEVPEPSGEASEPVPAVGAGSPASPDSSAEKKQQPVTPSSSSPETSTKGSESASQPPVIVQLLKQVWAIGLALTPVVVGIGRSLWRLLQLLASWIWKGWKFLLPRIRAMLPEGWNKLPDWTITTVAVLLLAFVLWLTTTLLLPTKAPANLGDRPPAASPPGAPKPPPAPDPALITKIQEQVASIADEYAEGLVQSIQTNVGDHRLTVKVGDAWYELAPTRQDSLANDLLKRSRRLDFEGLQITDSEGELLARSPVVGEKMVIYRRVKIVEPKVPGV